MTDAFVIETPRLTAGIAVRESSGFRFYASDLAFLSLDNRQFRALRELRSAVERQAGGPRELPRKRYNHDR